MPLFFKIIGQKFRSFERTYHVKGNHALATTIWALVPFENSILNRLWKLHLHLLAWEIWKENNKSIFCDKSRKNQVVYAIIKDTFMTCFNQHSILISIFK